MANNAVDPASAWEGLPGQMPQLSHRVRDTDDPVMVKSRRLIGGATDVLSLAQGVVHWGPPGLEELAGQVGATSADKYGPDEGLPELVQALRQKLADENGLTGYNVIVTAGANQAFSSIVLTLLDAPDRAVLFRPYYFNALMAIQMAGGAATLSLGPCQPETMHPDLDWLERQMQGPDPPKMVSIVSPNNPSGVVLSRRELDRAARICWAGGAWLVLDDTYEHFTYGDQPHHCVSGPHVIHVFSFSKAYGMMGYRVGYIAYPDFDGSNAIGRHLVKVQDTVPIHAALLSQRLALSCVRLGRRWVLDRVAGLRDNRTALLDAMSPLGKPGEAVWGDGAIYLWARLPAGCEDDESVVKWMVQKHGIAVIPGSASGLPGHIRATFGNPAPGKAFAAAAGRLKAALTELAHRGPGTIESVKKHQ